MSSSKVCSRHEVDYGTYQGDVAVVGASLRHAAYRGAVSCNYTLDVGTLLQPLRRRTKREHSMPSSMYVVDVTLYTVDMWFPVLGSRFMFQTHFVPLAVHRCTDHRCNLRIYALKRNCNLYVKGYCLKEF